MNASPLSRVRHWLLSGLAVVLIPVATAAPMSVQLTTTEKNQLQREARLVVDLVQNYHYSGATFQGIKNPEILDHFLSELDPRAGIFSPDDLQFLHRRFDRTLKTVYLFRGDLQPAFEIFDLYTTLALERVAWVERRLGQPFDFTVAETYTEPTAEAPAALDVPLDRRWELRLKDQLLAEMTAGQSLEEAGARLRRNYAEVERSLAALDSFAVRELFLDVAIRSFDPHSGYFSADSTREFAVVMEGSATGLGFEVQKVRGRCVVTAVHPGGPADLGSALAPGDTIEALAQGNGPWEDTSRQRLRETKALLRGTPGEKVRVAFRPEGSPRRQEVTLELQRVVLAAERAHGAISQVPAAKGPPRRIGWILLPAFYGGGQGPEATSAAADVRELLNQMAAANIEGLVIDLRNNPGGALTEAVAMSQLFLPGGMVLFSSGADRKLKDFPLKPTPPAYAGPLVLLTSAASASASEIFAGTMKFHHRALVVGGAATFGKGTSQAYIDLAKALKLTGDAVKDWGTLRLTVERFYLPDGGAVQGTGVASDIVLPSAEPGPARREESLPHALPPESIPIPASFRSAAIPAPVLPDSLRQHLSARAERDRAELPEWKLWQDEAAAKWDPHQPRSLLLTERREASETRRTAFAALRQTRREIAASAAFPTDPLEIAAVSATLGAHEARLRSLVTGDGKLSSHPWREGTYLVATEHGHLRGLRLDALDFTAFLGNATELAATYVSASGQAFTGEQMRAALLRLALLEERTDEAVVGVLLKASPGAPDPAVAHHGMEAVLGRMIELEPELTSERARLDVPLREGLRMGAAWADWLAAQPH